MRWRERTRARARGRKRAPGLPPSAPHHIHLNSIQSLSSNTVRRYSRDLSLYLSVFSKLFQNSQGSMSLHTHIAHTHTHIVHSHTQTHTDSAFVVFWGLYDGVGRMRARTCGLAITCVYAAARYAIPACYCSPCCICCILHQDILGAGYSICKADLGQSIDLRRDPRRGHVVVVVLFTSSRFL
jgi:hypothetical protein